MKTYIQILEDSLFTYEKLYKDFLKGVKDDGDGVKRLFPAYIEYGKHLKSMICYYKIEIHKERGNQI